MKGKEKKLYLMGEEKVSRALLKLGIPTMIGMMTSALYNLVDSYFVGRLGTAQMGAVSVVYPLSIIILGIGLLFGSGASSYLSRLLGNKKYLEADQCASTALVTSMVLAGVVIAGMLLLIDPLLHLLGATDTMMPYAKAYGIPFIVGLIFNVFNITFNNIISAEGASMFSMAAMLTGGVANMALDPILIFGCHMGVSGAAVATLFSRIISTAIYLLYLISGQSNLHFALKYNKLKKKIFIEIFKIGIPMLVYQGLCSVALAMTNTLAAGYGDAAVAAMGIVNRIISLVTMMLMGFLKGYQPFVGFNYGAGNSQRVRKATKLVMIWTTITCLITAILMITGSSRLVQVFCGKDQEVLALGSKALIFQAVTFMGMGYQVVHSFRFMGLGRAKEGGMISLGRQGIFFIPIILLMSAGFGLTGIMLAQPLTDLCSMILVFFLQRGNRRDMPQIA